MKRLSTKRWVLLVLAVLSAVPASGQQAGPLERANSCTAANTQLPSLPPRADEVRFVALGDTGRGCDDDGNEQCRVSRRMLSTQKATGFDLMLLLGDNVYESGKTRDFAGKLYGPYRDIAAAGVLIKGVVGNHDVRNREGTAIQMKFFESASAGDQAKFFTMPIDEQAKLSGGERTYYSFTRGSGGLVEFFALDSSMLTDDCCGPFSSREYPAADKQAQVEWLRAGLRASKAKWKIVLLHHPLYSSSKEHGVKVAKNASIKVNEEMEKIRTLEPIFVENGVRLVLAAHDHVYERIKPRKGVQYLVAGAGSETREGDLARRMPEFHHCGESRRSSFLLLAARPEQIDFWAIDDAGNVFDSGNVSGN